MEDVITEAPPPSRFLPEDLNNFTPPSPALPSPFILFSSPHHPEKLLRPDLLLIANSSSSHHLFHNISSKTLIGTFILPEVPFSGNTIQPSLGDGSCNIYSLSKEDNSTTVLVCFQFSAAPERAHIIAKLLIGAQIIPQRVLILDSIQSRNFRGKLSPDDTLFFKLDTSAERSNSSNLLLKDVDYFPSGSVVDGLGAALLSRCQMMNIKATLGLSWPESDHYATSLIKSALETALPNAKFNEGTFVREKNHLINSELYT